MPVDMHYGNHPPPDTLQLVLTGPVHFPGDVKSVEHTILSTSGSFQTTLHADAGANAGEPFTLTAQTQQTQVSVAGVVAYGVYLPVILR